MTAVNPDAGVLFYGDAHGEWGPLLRACADSPPAAVVILGDCDLERPLRMEIAPVLAAGIPVRWIPGNHDTDLPQWYDRLWGDDPAGSLHGRWARLGGMTVAGLGGVYKGRVWSPKVGDETPTYRTRAELLRATPRAERWRGGLALMHRDTILPEDHTVLRRVRADVLACHEGPTSHRHGFGGIDDLARDMRVRLVVHGHHHTSYSGRTRDGIWVQGLAKAETFRLSRNMLG